MLTPTRRLCRQALMLIALAAFVSTPAANAYPSGPIRGAANYPSGPLRPALVLRSAQPILDRGAATAPRDQNLPPAGSTVALRTALPSRRR